MKVYEYIPTNSGHYEIFKEVSFEDVKDIFVKWPESCYSNPYDTKWRGGSNLTIGEIVEFGKTLKIIGGFPKKVSIRDANENKLYVYEYQCAN